MTLAVVCCLPKTQLAARAAVTSECHHHLKWVISRWRPEVRSMCRATVSIVHSAPQALVFL